MHIENSSAEASLTNCLEIKEIEQRIAVSWKDGSTSRRMTLPVGRHFVGDSDFAAIQTKPIGDNICGMVLVDDSAVILRCTGPRPTLFVEGRKLSQGDSITIGDVLDLVVGRQSMTISVLPKNISFQNGVSASAQNNSNAKSPSKSNDKWDQVDNGDKQFFRSQESSNPFQAEAERLFDDVDGLRAFVARKLIDQLNLAGIELSKVDSPVVRESARLKLRKLVLDIEFPNDFPLSQKELESQIFDEVMGLGPLEPLLADEQVTEIMVNRRDQIYIERAGKLFLSQVHFSSDQALLNVIERIVSTVGRRIDQSSPIVDARLLDGSRVNAVIPPLALKGPNLTIRRFSKKPISVDRLVGFGSLNEEMATFLKRVVESHKNVIISGGTGSGKTTLLNALSSFIPLGERIVTVEDAAELQLQQEHVISLETRPPNIEGKGAVTIRDLVRNTLRMRPDRIIVGECRGGEALDMLQAMNTGHDGSMTTAHANAPEDMLRRLETMVLMAGMELPLRAIREQISSALCLIVQQTRRKNGRRLVTEISWVRGLDAASGQYEAIPLFSRDRTEHIHRHDEAIAKFLVEEEVDL